VVKEVGSIFENALVIETGHFVFDIQLYLIADLRIESEIPAVSVYEQFTVR
jgi:hypothetical protein